MLLESNLNDRSIIIFDCESVNAIDKGAITVRGHPDKILPGMVETIKSVAKELGEAINTESLPAPSTMEVRFGFKVDSNAIVSVARSENDAQVLITLRFG